MRRFAFRVVELEPSLPAPSVSIVIPCRNEGAWLSRTLASLALTVGSIPHEVIVVDDGSTDGSCDNLDAPPSLALRVLRGRELGVAGARNLGAAHARGDVLLFHDAHLLHRPGWLAALLEPLRDERIHAVCPLIRHVEEGTHAPIAQFYGGTWDRYLRWRPIAAKPPGVAEVPLLPGGCAAVRRAVFERLGGFDPAFSGWGYEDQEFSLRLWRTGHRIVVQPAARVVHIHRRKRYPIDTRTLRRNLLRMVLVHLDPPRVAKVLWCWRNDWDLAQLVAAQLVSPEHLQRRAEVDAGAAHGADWFFRRFAIPF